MPKKKKNCCKCRHFVVLKWIRSEHVSCCGIQRHLTIVDWLCRSKNQIQMNKDTIPSRFITFSLLLFRFPFLFPLVETRKRVILTAKKKRREREFLTEERDKMEEAIRGSCNRNKNNKSFFVSKGKKEDSYHVLYKVPYGDSPYVRAKHAQVPYNFSYLSFL